MPGVRFQVSGFRCQVSAVRAGSRNLLPDTWNVPFREACVNEDCCGQCFANRRVANLTRFKVLGGGGDRAPVRPTSPRRRDRLLQSSKCPTMIAANASPLPCLVRLVRYRRSRLPVRGSLRSGDTSDLLCNGMHLHTDTASAEPPNLTLSADGCGGLLVSQLVSTR